MPRKKRASAEQPIGVGLTAKQMKRKKPLFSGISGRYWTFE